MKDLKQKLQDLRYDLTDEEFNATISSNIKQITEASE